MKSFTWCLFVMLPMIAGCKGELAAVQINLSADGSGQCEVGGVRDVQFTEDPSARAGGVFEGATDAKSVDLRVHQVTAKFASIEALKIGDITFSMAKEEGMNLLTVHIPASSSSKWFESFGVTAKTLDEWNRIDDSSRKANAERKKADPKATNLAFESPKPPNVRFEINLPVKPAGQGFETVPLGLASKVAADHGERQASLSIPISEIHANKMKEVVWKIRYGSE
jgi:hypothetical protein